MCPQPVRRARLLGYGTWWCVVPCVGGSGQGALYALFAASAMTVSGDGTVSSGGSTVHRRGFLQGISTAFSAA